MNLALDTFGGDKAPAITIAGALKALADQEGFPPSDRFGVTLFGSLRDMQPYLPPELPDGLNILDTSGNPQTGPEADAHAVTEDPNAPLRLIMRLHAEGTFDAVISAGSTGAQVLASLYELDKCQGITRPAVGAFLPTATGRCYLIDVGASLTASPHHLVQFAAMGSVYVRELLGVPEPKIGLINVAEEASRGNTVAVQAHKLLTESGLNFVGFIEGREIPAGVVDVAVVNGFVGNVLLKFAEGIPTLLSAILSNTNDDTKLDGLASMFDYHAFGGEPLLGVKGVSVICHGASSERAIASALNQSAKIARIRLHEKIEAFISERFSTYYSQVKYLRSFRRDLRPRE